MSDHPQQLLISGTILFLISLLIGFVVPALTNARMGVSAHVAGIQGAIILWAFGLMWARMSLPAAAETATVLLSVGGLFAIFVSLSLAAVWGTSRATPIAGAGHQATAFHETFVTSLLLGGSLASLAAGALVLWGLWAWKA
jgi:hydroxylaminobenzene mutase